MSLFTKPPPGKNKKGGGSESKILHQIHQINKKRIDKNIYKKSAECFLEDIHTTSMNKFKKCVPGTDEFKKMIHELGFNYSYRKTDKNLINISLKSSKHLFGHNIQVPKDSISTTPQSSQYRNIIILLVCIDFNINENSSFNVILDPHLKFVQLLKIFKCEKKELYEYIVIELFNKNRIITI